MKTKIIIPFIIFITTLFLGCGAETSGGGDNAAISNIPVKAPVAIPFPTLDPNIDLNPKYIPPQ